MKKLVLFLGAAIVAASCTNHVSYGKLEFDYPADVTISDKSDNDDGSMTIFFDKDKSFNEWRIFYTAFNVAVKNFF